MKKGAARRHAPLPRGERGEASAARQGQRPLERGRRPLQAIKAFSACAGIFGAKRPVLIRQNKN